jgi:hypothetical protein
MAQEQKHVVVTAHDHKEGANLASKWKAAGLGTLTHGDIYRAGLLALKAKLNPLARASQKANLAHA